MSSDNEFWAVGASNLVTIEKLANPKTGQYVNDATITGVLKDRNGATVTGGESVTFTYRSGTDGWYDGIVPSAAEMTAGVVYTLHCTAASGSNTVPFQVVRKAKSKTA